LNKNLLAGYFVHHMSHVPAWDRTQASMVIIWQKSTCTMAWSKCSHFTLQ